ncbi:228_t:CDS:2, partial [Ambispora leptoticha]
YIYGGAVSLENLETSDILDLLIAFNEFNFSEFVDSLQTRLIEDNASWLQKIRPYKKILEENLWDDIMAKFASPNKPITSTILP